MKICDKHKARVRENIVAAGLGRWCVDKLPAPDNFDALGLCLVTINAQAVQNNLAVLGSEDNCPICFLQAGEWCELVVADLVELAVKQGIIKPVTRGLPH